MNKRNNGKCRYMLFEEFVSDYNGVFAYREAILNIYNYKQRYKIFKYVDLNKTYNGVRLCSLRLI